MPKFGKTSNSRLETCDMRIQKLFNEVVKHFDCSILEGHRGKKAQNKAYKEGKSKVVYPDGKHNQIPSVAVDAVPYPIDWEDRERMTYFAGFVLGVALQMDLNIRWGGDWNMNTQLKDNNFDDLPHFEIRE
ncbi:peptidase M15 [uncultured Mediterranean phage uvDeep-CGR2-KM18-C269]|nr:peptidase M15 [uncultured Mediterranean phage uvDeep-CGR2-KM18-C269]